MTVKITRTTQATIKIRFYSASGQPAVPPSATIKLQYRDLNNEVVDVETAMTLVGGVFQYVWDSTPARPGVVQGHIHSGGDEPVGEDFTFEVKANAANMA